MLYLTQRLETPAAATASVTLPIDVRVKSRVKVTLNDGREAGLLLPRGLLLRGLVQPLAHPDQLRYHHDHVLDDMLRQFGLTVTFGQLPFEPEAGAYASESHGHHHAHHAHHAHSH